MMRQRAIRIELEPRIEEPCMADLGAFCSEDLEKGDVSGAYQSLIYSQTFTCDEINCRMSQLILFSFICTI